MLFKSQEKFISADGEEKEKRLDVKVLFYKRKWCDDGRYVEGVITSVAEQVRDGYTYVWILIEGKRSKELLNNCIADTRCNREKIARINQIIKNIKDLEKKRQECVLKKVTLKMLGGD